MKGHVLAAGWPFAGLLALDAVRSEVSSAAPVCGVIVETDPQSGTFVLESSDVTCPLTSDAATRCFGVDGYPIAQSNIHVGDMVEAVREQHGDEWVTTKVRVLRLASFQSSGWC
jgi:hypothetical protein